MTFLETANQLQTANSGSIYFRTCSYLTHAIALKLTKHPLIITSIVSLPTGSLWLCTGTMVGCMLSKGNIVTKNLKLNNNIHRFQGHSDIDILVYFYALTFKLHPRNGDNLSNRSCNYRGIHFFLKQNTFKLLNIFCS